MTRDTQSCAQPALACAMERRRLDTRLEVKSVDAQGRFAGYASVFNVIDSQRDIILRGAFEKTLKGRIGEIKLLWQHQQDEPIGMLDRVFEDRHGLYVEGRLLLHVRRAQEAHALLKAGAISGLSIGYSPKRYRVDPDSGVRRLAEVELWEISLVTFPANAAAGVTVVKQSGDEMEWKRASSTGQLIELSNAIDRALNALRCAP